MAPEHLARLSSPVGLGLGGDTPAETALSIAAEIVLLGRRGSGGRLTETTGPVHRPTGHLTAAG